jgi:hypothetical protein
MREKPTRTPVYSWMVMMVFLCTFIVYFVGFSPPQSALLPTCP